MFNTQKKRIGIFMLLLIVFSAVHMNVALAVQSFGSTKTPIDLHPQPHESQQDEHVSCTSDTYRTFSHRTDTEYHDGLINCLITRISGSLVLYPQIFVEEYQTQEFSRKPITLTHNIILRT